MTRKTIAVAALACVALAACNNGERRSGMASGGGGKLCLPFAAAPTAAAGAPGSPGVPAAVAAPSAGMDDCLHRWGYALAASPDPANDVAQATVAACTSALARWNQGAMAPAAGAPSEAPSLITGEDTNPMAERYRFASTRALFYVVQARAGKCGAPPMKDGVPEGLTP